MFPRISLRKNRCWYSTGIALAITGSAVFSQTRPEPFIIGADVSWILEEEGRGVRYFDNGVQKDIFQILRDHKFNYIRLRIFHNPRAPSGGSVETTGAVYAGALLAGATSTGAILCGGM